MEDKITKVTDTAIRVTTTMEQVIPIQKIVDEKRQVEAKLKDFEQKYEQQRQIFLTDIARLDDILKKAEEAGVAVKPKPPIKPKEVING